MSQQQQLEHERYAADIEALMEAIARGVSQRSIEQLAGECGIDHRDLEQLYRSAA